MLFSRSAEYAIRALVHLGGAPEAEKNFALVKTVAENTAIPGHFLAKIMQQLARKGLLVSSKGPAGGFRLARSAKAITLFDIVDSMDGMGQYERCLAGHEQCTDPALCALQDSSAALRSRIMVYLERTSVADLARAVPVRGRKPERQRQKKIRRVTAKR